MREPCLPSTQKRTFASVALFSLRVVSFAEMMLPDLAIGIDQVVSRPRVVVERIPNRVGVVERDRIFDAETGYRFLDVGGVLLEGEFGGVHANYDEAAVAIFLRPGANIGKRPQAI